MRLLGRRENRLPELNMQSLPDLIFTVLFFFMLVTTMRSVPVKVKYQSPEGTVVTPLKKQNSTLYVFVGYLPGRHDSLVVQVNDRYVPLAQVAEAVAQYRDLLLPDEQEMMTVSMKIDRQAPMGLVNEVKMALREVGALRVHYSAVRQQMTGLNGGNDE